MGKNANKTNQRGFTIVELVVAIVIAGFIMPAVALALNDLVVTNYQARDLTLANMASQNKVENLRSIGFNSIPSSGTVSFTSELPTTLGNPRSASYTVTTPATGIKQIDINISYTIYKKTRSLAYRTYISELGVGQ